MKLRETECQYYLVLFVSNNTHCLFVFDKQILNLLCRVIVTDFQDKIGKEMIVLYTYQNGKYTNIQNY